MLSTPKDLEPYDKAYNLSLKRKDEDMWRNGYYLRIAMIDAIGQCFSGKSGGKTIYPEKPMLAEAWERRNMSQEEIDRIEIEKMIANERLWSAKGIADGLPTTI